MAAFDDRRGQVAVRADEDVVATSRARELEARVRELERLLGRKTLEVEVLKEALAAAREKSPLGSCRRRHGRFAVKLVADTLGVARSNLVGQLRGATKPRSSYQRQGDAELLAAIRQITDARPTYGYHRITALLNRARQAAGLGEPITKPPPHKGRPGFGRGLHHPHRSLVGGHHVGRGHGRSDRPCDTSSRACAWTSRLCSAPLADREAIELPRWRWPGRSAGIPQGLRWTYRTQAHVEVLARRGDDGGAAQRPPNRRTRLNVRKQTGRSGHQQRS